MRYRLAIWGNSTLAGKYHYLVLVSKIDNPSDHFTTKTLYRVEFVCLLILLHNLTFNVSILEHKTEIVFPVKHVKEASLTCPGQLRLAPNVRYWMFR